ncbi:hypothetical protein C7B65_11875 [Phormidesmis priestleyi ULC007]|uniref:Uncharacterized protein n=1 Tax=Phormidesmis priestleyi ULC007 TaxID=1920490 RepID=A0A2T1DFL7_9CYAN|nr:hypothetical protein [Phormidesmis priestleyi]PSB19266.1 hypothetical protein C7B65_11875 [Phormidesmis priestleyi ULC007]PZO52150.1 MAG: hypothetical protein DCF14_06655 [Phormidesmis priestleyi]
MRRQTSPVAARYLLARLRPLTRPIFWGPAIALMFVILFTWQYWMRPEWLSYFGVNASSGDTSGLSPEDRAIGADIDTLPMLFNDFGVANSASKQADPAKSDLATSTDLAKLPQIPIPGSAIAPQSSDKSVGNSNVFGATMQKLGLPDLGLTGNSTIGGAANSTQLQNSNNLGSVLDLNNLLKFPTVGTSTENSSQAASTNYGTSPEGSVTPSNNRPTQTPSSFTSIAPSTPIEGATSLGNFGVNAAPTTPYTNSYTSIVEGTQPLPVNGTVPVVPPIVPISPLSTQPQPVLSPQPLSNSSSLNAIPAPLVPQQPQSFPTNDVPFTAPRPIPGRVLGGGQINTFSNP